MPKLWGNRPKKTPMQWVPVALYGTHQALTIGNVNSFELMGATPVLDTNPPDILRYTLLAIRGRVTLTPAFTTADASSAAHVHMGIIANTRSFAAGPPQYDPSQGTDAGASWLWLEHLHLVIPAGNQNIVNSPQLPTSWDVHIKTKRVFHEGMTLSFQTSTAMTNGSSMTVDCDLRCLIARVA